MTTPIVLFLIALLLAGAGLFVHAYVRGMRFGERMEEQKRADKERKNLQNQSETNDSP